MGYTWNNKNSLFSSKKCLKQTFFRHSSVPSTRHRDPSTDRGTDTDQVQFKDPETDTDQVQFKYTETDTDQVQFKDTETDKNMLF